MQTTKTIKVVQKKKPKKKAFGGGNVNVNEGDKKQNDDVKDNNKQQEGLEGKTTTETIDPSIGITINNEENGFEMICQSCGASNWINSTHNYICNNCSFSLL